MSEKDVDVVRGMFTALDSQDWEAALGRFDPAVEWSPTEGTFHGLEGLATSLMEWLEPWEEHRIEAEEFTEAGDQVLAVIRLVGRMAGSRMEVDQRFFQVYTVSNGKIIRMVEFGTRDRALEAAGPSE
jgi:ketosteroid isomerase-like protein